MNNYIRICSSLICVFYFLFNSNFSLSKEAMKSSSLCDLRLVNDIIADNTFLDCSNLGEKDSIVYSLSTEEGATLHLLQKQSNGKIATRKMSGWGVSVLSISNSKKTTNPDSLLIADKLDDSHWLIAIRTRAEHDVAWIYAWVFDARNKLQRVSFSKPKVAHDFLAHDPYDSCTWNPESREIKIGSGQARTWKLDKSPTKFSELIKQP